MRCCTRPRPPERRPGPSTLTLTLTLLLSLWAVAATAATIEFQRVELEREDGLLRIDADIRYAPGPAVLEALDNGIPLTFELTLQLRQRDLWPWQAPLLERRERSVLRFHPLSGLYELRSQGSGRKLTFATRKAALTALGELRNWPVVALDDLPPGVGLELRLRSGLVVDALPLPLRPLAHISAAWRLRSEDWVWRLNP